MVRRIKLLKGMDPGFYDNTDTTLEGAYLDAASARNRGSCSLDKAENRVSILLMVHISVAKEGKMRYLLP